MPRGRDLYLTDKGIEYLASIGEPVPEPGRMDSLAVRARSARKQVIDYLQAGDLVGAGDALEEYEYAVNAMDLDVVELERRIRVAQAVEVANSGKWKTIR